jgi:hypothetical protein
MTPFDPHNPPHLDMTPRSGLTSARQILVLNQKFESANTLSVATGILFLWHDHWDKAHEVAQADEGEPDHDFLHGIVHRREGDLSNANYWFRSAGSHPCFPSIAARVQPHVGSHPLGAKLLRDGTWNPAGFVEAVRQRKTAADNDFLRVIQGLEMMTYYEWIVNRV